MATLGTQHDGPSSTIRGPGHGLDHTLEERDVEVVGRWTVHLDLGHEPVVEPGGDIAEGDVGWRGHRIPSFVLSGQAATSAITSSLCSPLKAAWRWTVRPVWRENRTGWGITL